MNETQLQLQSNLSFGNSCDYENPKKKKNNMEMDSSSVWEILCLEISVSVQLLYMSKLYCLTNQPTYSVSQVFLYVL